MKGKIAVRFLLAMFIAIILIVVAVYLIYVSIRGGNWNCTKCKTEFTVWCSKCYVEHAADQTTWDGGPELGDDLYECINDCGFWTSASGPDQRCNNDAKEPCKVMGVYD